MSPTSPSDAPRAAERDRDDDASRARASKGGKRPFALRALLARRGGGLALVAALLVLNAVLGLANPYLVQALVDRVILARRPDLLWGIAAAFLGVAAVRFGISLAQGQVYTALSSRVLLDLRREFLARLQTLSLSFFAGARYGELVVRFNRDLAQVQEFATSTLPSLATSALTVVGVSILGLAYDWELFLLAVSSFPIAMLVARLYRGRIEGLTRSLRTQSGELATTVNETLVGQRTVRSFGRERRELAKLVERGHALIRTSLAFQWTNAWASGLPRFCTVISTVVVYAVGGARVIRGELELGELIALSMYVGLVFAPLMGLVDAYLELAQVRVSLARVRELFEAPAGVDEDERAPLPAAVRGVIAFEDVRFRHVASVPLLEGVSFRVEAGETVALVGPSGAGKSTIVDLLFRFLDPQSGRVTIDGQDLRAVRASALRREMAVVSQDVFLFHDTVRENVRYGRAGASDTEVEAAARASGVDTMLPKEARGLDTVVGERGAQLSAGQRQRIAIARALLRDPKILVLDEATSALDARADEDVRRALGELSRGRTTLIVTHHLDRLAGTTRVLRLGEDGRIVDERAASSSTAPADAAPSPSPRRG
ncbi:MAG: ABC transporter ATP-binding protein [Planctomycetes bacterium]|nr:ABC transporter ATP-binding protein [Planctomycetota bacterium]